MRHEVTCSGSRMCRGADNETAHIPATADLDRSQNEQASHDHSAAPCNY